MFSVVFIATFLSSIVGAQLFGISLNKIALIPLLLYLFIKERKIKFKMSRLQMALIVWYVINILSCINGICFNYLCNIDSQSILKSQVLWMIQVAFMYIPMALLLWNSNNFYEYKNCFEKAFCLTARIQTVWALAQFLLYYILDFDLNSAVFEKFMGGMLGGGLEWTRFSNISGSNGGILLRITGLNKDAAFLALILLIGFILDKNLIWKFMYFATTVLALSRSGMIAIMAVMFCMIIYNCKNKIKLKNLMRTMCALVCVLLIVILVYSNVEFVRIQIGRLIERMATIQTGGDGTSRHMGYIGASVVVLITETPFPVKLFGIGMGCAGNLLSIYHSAVSWLDLSSSMLSVSNAWAIECDFANVLLGTGLIGSVSYYFMWVNSFVKHHYDHVAQLLIIGLLLFSLMYNLAGLTYMQLIMIIYLVNAFKSDGLMDQ